MTLWGRIQPPSQQHQHCCLGVVNLLSADRTAMITGDIRPLRAAPERGARVRYRAEPGVVGRISNCRRGWCEFDVRGRSGFVQTRHLYGVDEDERVD